MRARSIWVIPTALIAGITLALPLTSLTAQAATKKPVGKITSQPAQSVTLPTGDLVRLSGTGAKTKVQLEPAAASGPGRVLTGHRQGADEYVWPAVAEPYLGRFLDVGIFDVTRIAAGRKANGQLPVRISYHGSAPTVPGVKITSASAGVATGYLTSSSSAAFGRALTAQWKADSKAGWPARSTLFGDVTKISSGLPGTVTVTPKYPMFTLIIKEIGADGKPEADGFADIMNVDNSEKYLGFVEVQNGEARISVPKGNYSAIADDFISNAAGTAGTIHVSTVPGYKVTGAGQTLTIDQRKATVQPTPVVPKKASVSDLIFTWDRSDASDFGSLSTLYFVDPSIKLLLAPSKDATVGNQDSNLGWSLAGPGTKPAYTYTLDAFSKHIPATSKYTFTAADLATIESSYYGDGVAKTGAIARSAVFPSQDSNSAVFEPVALASKRTEYVGAIGGTPVWYETALANNDAQDDPGFVDGAPRTIAAGTTSTLSWLKGPLGAAVPTQPKGGDFPYCYACRTSKSLEVSLAPFTDSVATHSGELWSSEDGLPVSRFRFYVGKKKVSDEDDYLGNELNVPTAKTTYKAVLDVDRRLQLPNESTSSQTVLTFKSAKGSGPKNPTGWYCDVAATCNVLPILQGKVALATSLNGTLPAGKSKVTVTLAQIQGATTSPITSATLEFRPAGLDWSSVTLKSIGGGKYTGEIDNTGTEGSVDDVRIGGADKAGSTFLQTVLRAYTVAAH